MSLLVEEIVLAAQETHPDVPGHVIASSLSVVVGGIVCAIGLLRCGWIVELISLSSVTSFVTGAAFEIATGQVRLNTRLHQYRY
jgi:solute carrier family 26 (sodium-independent sulfate anion transporter), member 11